MASRRYRAGESVEDYCRACKTDRMHTVVVVDGLGQPLRVSCGYCRSEHNFRGGPRVASAPLGTDSRDRPAAEPPAPPAASAPTRAVSPQRPAPAAAAGAWPLVSDRERSAPPIMPHQDGPADLETMLRRVIREETGLTPAAPAEKWRGGTLVLRPANPDLQEKTWPIETFFQKVVMVRNRLRTLEQQVNAADLPDDVKIKIQGYVTGCYGSLTSFNVLFAEEGDKFKGGGGIAGRCH